MLKVVWFWVIVLLCQVHQVSAQSSDSVIYDWLKSQNIPVTENKVKLLKSGSDKFDALFQDVRQAEHSVHFDYFAVRNDSISNTLFKILASKKKQGVQVRALYDAFANLKSARPIKKRHLRALNDLGVEIRPWGPISFPWVNHAIPRDHRKIAVIDGKIAYTGGMNIADYYILGIPQAGPWRDMQVRIEGEAANDFQRIFLDSWNGQTKQKLDADEYSYAVRQRESGTFKLARIPRQDSLMLHLTGNSSEWETAANVAEQELRTLEKEKKPYVAGPILKGPLPQIPSSEYMADVAVLHRAPGKTPSIMRDFYVTSLNAAKDKVVIINPYFTPTHKVNKAIKDAIDRGVEVEIMISTNSDVHFTPEIGMRTVNKLRKRGAKVYLFDAGFHHTKIMTVDGKFCTVGSTNLDSRSLRYDYEINAVILNPGPTNELIQMFENDKKTSHELTDEVWKKRSFWKKLQGTLGSCLIWCI